MTRQRLARRGLPLPQFDQIKILTPALSATALLIFGFLCTLVDPVVYERVIKEPNLMFGNWSVYLWTGACALFFIFGSSVSGFIYSRLRHSPRPWIDTILTQRLTIMYVLFLVLAVLNLILVLLRLVYLQSTIGLNTILAAYQGASGTGLRDQIIESISSGSVGWISDFTLALTSSLIWLALQIPRSQRKPYLIVAYASLTIFLVSCLFTLARDIMLTGLLITIFLHIASMRGQGFNSRFKAFLLIFLGIVVFAGLFALVGNSRASGGQDTLLRQFLGYFPASYNRLAGLLDGTLIYPNSGTGYYSLQWFWDFPAISRTLYDAGKSWGIDLPSSAIDNWSNQFQAVQSAYLNRSYIWSTAFGFAYSDFGWFGVIYFFWYGIISGFLYKDFQRGGAAGGMLYPYLLTTIIKWWSILYVSARTTDIMVIVFIFVMALAYFLKSLAVPAKHEEAA